MYWTPKCTDLIINRQSRPVKTRNSKQLSCANLPEALATALRCDSLVFCGQGIDGRNK